ncbi:MAG: PLD nuclease N-terminal domain-containing protein [Clostridiales Family XIII bacterium]|jgi:hypothetical protein|nr:PLD nuclease N-terminal domain-containing protein [Clostridiales Family XIII bacterium]
MLNELGQYLPFLIPIAVIQLALTVAAVIHILRHDTYRFGNRALWLVVSICVNVIGPILYFSIGKGED